MTLSQIMAALTQAGKPTSKAQAYRYLNACRIEPVGIRQRPQQYPDNAADVVLQHLGLSGPHHTPPPTQARRSGRNDTAARLVKMPRLRAERQKARAK